MPEFSSGGFGAKIDNVEITDNTIELAKLARTGTAGQVLTSGGAGADVSWTGAGSLILIDEADLSGGAATNISIGSLNLSAYKFALVVWSCKADAGSNGLRLTLNSDTGNNYDYGECRIDSSSNSSNVNQANIIVGSSYNNQFSAGHFFIETTQDNKAVWGIGGYGGQSSIFSGVWHNGTPAAITTITLTSAANNLTTDTYLKIYGVK